MSERSSKRGQGPKDANQTAFAVVQQALGEAPKVIDIVTKAAREKNAAAVTLGRLGGIKGGKSRAEKLTPERRREIAMAAARARWEKSRQ